MSSSSRILVIGDAIADVYREFEFRKMCPDALGTPAAYQIGRDVRPGGAANVAVNLAALDPEAEIHLISVISNELRCVIKRSGSDRIGMGFSILADPDQSIYKEGVLISGMDRDQSSFVARLDNRIRIEESDADAIESSLERFLDLNPDIDLIVLSDYAGGVMTEGVLRLLSPFRKRLLVDTKRTDLSCFSGSLLAKLNSLEHIRVLQSDRSPERHFKYFIVTRGEMGSRLTVSSDSSFPCHTFTSTTATFDFPAKKVDAVDVCGCGDTFLAGLAAGIVRYHDPFAAVSFANAAAATVVVKPRTAVADLRKTLEMIEREV